MVKTIPGPSDRGDHRPFDWTDSSEAGADLTWSVGAVSRRLGVAASTLRTWERRYGIGPSHRTQGGHRRYVESDIDRVEFVRRLVSRGVSAQDAARVAEGMTHEELADALTEGAPTVSSPDRADVLEATLAATIAGDGRRLQDLISTLLEQQGLADAWGEVFAPLLSRIAMECSAGSLELEAERMATEILLHEMRRVRARGTHVKHPQVLLISAVDDEVCMPLVGLGAALVDADVTTRTLGAEVGPDDIAAVVQELRPQVLLWWEQPAAAEGPTNEHLQRDDVETFLMRAGPAWPHEIGLRFGAESPLVRTSLRGALGHVLDRVS